MTCTIKFSKCSLTRHRVKIQMDAKLERHFLYHMSGLTTVWFKTFMLMDTKLLLTPFRKWYFGTTNLLFYIQFQLLLLLSAAVIIHPSISARRNLFLFLIKNYFHSHFLVLIFLLFLSRIFHCFSSLHHHHPQII